MSRPWVLYAYTDQPVLPGFDLVPLNRFELAQDGHPDDYREVRRFPDRDQALEHMRAHFARCQGCRGWTPSVAVTDKLCPSCRFYAVQRAGGGGVLGLQAASAWAAAWATEHPELAERWVIVIRAPST